MNYTLWEIGAIFLTVSTASLFSKDVQDGLVKPSLFWTLLVSKCVKLRFSEPFWEARLAGFGQDVG